MMRIILCWLGAAGAIVGLAGCSLSKPFPEKSFFRLYPVKFSEPDQLPGVDQVVSIESFSASEEFDGKGFVYRLGGQKFEVDFYNEWLTQPRSAVTEWVRRALIQDGHFAAVVDSSSRVQPDIRIEGRVLEWFADFSERSHPQVVVAIEMRWLKAGPDGAGKSETQLYRERIQPATSDPAALVVAWQEAMDLIVSSFLEDLKSINP